MSLPQKVREDHARNEHEVVEVFDHNTSGEIRNPLSGIPKAQLLEQVAAFARGNDLVDVLPVLEKGALAAQNPLSFDTIQELDANDKKHLLREATHRWHHPRMLYFTILMSSIGAAVQGSNGANLSFPSALGIPDSGPICQAAGTCERNSWLVGFVNACPNIAMAVFAGWMSDPINNLIGRRATIFVGAIFSLLSPIGSALSQTWPQLVVCRLLLGLGMGLKEVTVPVFSAEVAPTNIRGGLIMSWQAWVAFGILLGTCANLVLVHAGAITWRLQLGSAFVPAVPLVLGIFWCPESPRWLMSKRRYKEAYRSLCKLRNSELQAARDLYAIYAQMEQERRAVLASGSTSFVTRLVEIFTVPRLRRASQASAIAMVTQIFCGINIIAFYSSTIFAQAGASNVGALLASFGFGLVNFIFAWPAVWTIDTFGRRALLLFTFPNMFWTLLAAGMSFYIHGTHRLAVIALFIYLFDAFYSPGAGPVPFTYAAEVWPTTHRDIGMAWAVTWINLWAVLLSITFPRMLLAFTVTGSFGFYAGLNMVMFVLVFFCLPETARLTLEEMDYVFATPTRTHVRFQAFRVLPWFVKKHLLRVSRDPKPELFHFATPQKFGPSEKTATEHWDQLV